MSVFALLCSRPCSMHMRAAAGKCASCSGSLKTPQLLLFSQTDTTEASGLQPMCADLQPARQCAHPVLGDRNWWVVVPLLDEAEQGADAPRHHEEPGGVCLGPYQVATAIVGARDHLCTGCVSAASIWGDTSRGWLKDHACCVLPALW